MAPDRRRHPEHHLHPKAAPDWYPTFYHCNADKPDTVDWGFYAKGVKLMNQLLRGLDEGVLPYDLTARAAEITDLSDQTTLADADVGAALNSRVQDAVADFTAAAEAFQTDRDSLKPRAASRVNARLLRIEKLLCGNLTALDWWDGTTIPHAQVLWDLQGVQAALAALPGDPDAAKSALDGVGYTYYGKEFSRKVFLLEQERHDPASRAHLLGRVGPSPAADRRDAGLWRHRGGGHDVS